MVNALIVSRIKKRTGSLTSWLVVYHTLWSGVRQSQEQLLCVAGGSCPSIQYECTAWGQLFCLNAHLCRDEGVLCAQGDNIWSDYIIPMNDLKYCSARQGAELRSLLVWELDFSYGQVTVSLSPLALLFALKRRMSALSPHCWLMPSFQHGKTSLELSFVLWLKMGYKRTCSFLYWSQRQQMCWALWNVYPRPYIVSVRPRVYLFSCSLSAQGIAGMPQMQAPQMLLTACEGNMLMKAWLAGPETHMWYS